MSDYGPLSLQIPEPSVRPGDRPDFSYVSIPEAGSVRRPPVDVKPADIWDLADTLIRVLDGHGQAVGPWAGACDDETALKGLRAMMKTRAYDERMLKAQRQGKTSFYLQCTGEEAIAVGFQLALSPGDMNFPTYRQQGLLIARDHPLLELMCQVYSNSRDLLRGRQPSSCGRSWISSGCSLDCSPVSPTRS